MGLTQTSKKWEYVTMYKNPFSKFFLTILGGLMTLTLTRAADETSATRNLQPDKALRKLMSGNARFVSGQAEGAKRSPKDFSALTKGQNPSAIVIACADSRVSPELLFDAGIGDLFVIRLAGNVVDGAGVAMKGSVEYAVAELDVALIIVLGHSNCGAVNAAVKHIDQSDSLPGAINGLVELIKPAAAKAKAQPGDIYANTTTVNVELGVEKLKAADPIIAPRVKDGRVKVIGAIYDLKTGKVALTSAEK